MSFAAAFVAACALTGATLVFGPRVERNESLALELAAATLGLERAIGYGGVVHAFKNHVLRPDEPSYLDVVLTQSRIAARHLGTLERIATELGERIDIGDARTAIAGYATEAARVSDLHARGLSARQIDRVVRIDDTDALIQIQAVSALIHDRLESNLKVARRVNDAWKFGFAVFVLISLASTALALAGARRRQHLLIDRARSETAELQDMTRIATHDIRQPLRQIGFLVDEVLDSSADAGVLSDENRADLALIADRCRRLDSLVAETLGVLRIAAMTSTPEPVDLPAMVRHIVALDAPPGTELAIDGVASVVADPQMLQVILRNLVSNAVKHGDKDRLELRVIARRTTDGTLITVEDNGPGIAPEHRVRVFDLFATLAPAASDAVSGVGLAAVRKLTRAMGGNVAIVDGSLGGARFDIHLPA